METKLAYLQFSNLMDFHCLDRRFFESKEKGAQSY